MSFDNILVEDKDLKKQGQKPSKTIIVDNLPNTKGRGKDRVESEHNEDDVGDIRDWTPGFKRENLETRNQKLQEFGQAC